MSDQTQSGPLKPPEPLQSKDLLKIQRKLDAWELDHLREHAAALFARVEALEAQVEELNRQLADVEQSADIWHDLAIHLQERQGAQLAVTRDGRIGVLS